MNRYFFAHNANRMIAGVRFEAVDVQSGTMLGVMRASGALADELGLLAKDSNRTAVWEIPEGEYAEWLKKKSPSLENLISSNPPPPPPQAALIGEGAPVVQAANVHSLASDATKTAAEAVTVVEVHPPAAPSGGPPEGLKGRKGLK
jgi:hypothetical protein